MTCLSIFKVYNAESIRVLCDAYTHTVRLSSIHGCSVKVMRVNDQDDRYVFIFFSGTLPVANIDLTF